MQKPHIQKQSQELEAQTTFNAGRLETTLLARDGNTAAHPILPHHLSEWAKVAREYKNVSVAKPVNFRDDSPDR
jgi:hypothetical protein